MKKGIFKTLILTSVLTLSLVATMSSVNFFSHDQLAGPCNTDDPRPWKVNEVAIHTDDPEPWNANEVAICHTDDPRPWKVDEVAIHTDDPEPWANVVNC